MTIRPWPALFFQIRHWQPRPAETRLPTPHFILPSPQPPRPSGLLPIPRTALAVPDRPRA